MAEYIDKDIVIELIQNYWYEPYSTVAGIIHSYLVEDVAPVKHGKWISVDADVIFSCSNCENEVSTSWDYDAADMFTYCPCCGARMDLKEEAK